MRKIKVLGTQNFMGVEIPVVLGGFGEDKKCISDKTIAEIHNITPRDVRKTVTRNEIRFKELVDFLDLKRWESGDHLLKQLGYSDQQIIQAEHIYILSERGYAKLIKIMDTDLAWEIHDKLIDEYFALREEKQQATAKIDAATFTGLARTGNLVRIVMKDEGAAPCEIAQTLDALFRKGGLVLPEQFIKAPQVIDYSKLDINEYRRRAYWR